MTEGLILYNFLEIYCAVKDNTVCFFLKVKPKQDKCHNNNTIYSIFFKEEGLDVKQGFDGVNMF